MYLVFCLTQTRRCNLYVIGTKFIFVGSRAVAKWVCNEPVVISLRLTLSVVNITIGIFSDYSRWSSHLARDDLWQNLSKGTNVGDLSKVPVSANSQSSWYRESEKNVKNKHISTKNVFSSNIYHSFKAKHGTEIPNGIPIWMTPQRGQGSYTQKNKEINTSRCKIAIFWQQLSFVRIVYDKTFIPLFCWQRSEEVDLSVKN